MGLFDRLFSRRPNDPADATIGWLADKSLDDRRIVAGLLFGGPYSRRVTEWIVARLDCDAGTASMVLWNMCRPDICLKDEASEREVTGVESLALARCISARWRCDGFAPAVFAWDPRGEVKRYRCLLTKRFDRRDPLDLPEAAWKPVAGRQPLGSRAANIDEGKELNALLGWLRLADLAMIKPEFWEADYRKTYT